MQIAETTDHAAWAASLGVSTEAVDLFVDADVVDLHLDTFLWTRIAGYRLDRAHGSGLFHGRFYGHCDVPRMRAGGIDGAFWSITTNPFRSPAGRARTFRRNLARLKADLDAAEGVSVVRNTREYRAARAAGDHAAWIVVQGGNAFDADLSLVGSVPDDLVVSITLVHLSTSSLGVTSAPGPRSRAEDRGLTSLGRDFVGACDAARILVDLAHIHPDGFWDAVEVHDPSLPLAVTHTGVDGVHPMWRNVDDDQIRAIARTGGVVGVIYADWFLGGTYWGARGTERIFAHLAHIVDVAGEDTAALGSDWDGMICPPTDLPTCLEMPRVVQHMLDAGWGEERIGKVLGGNALRTMEGIRP